MVFLGIIKIYNFYTKNSLFIKILIWKILYELRPKTLSQIIGQENNVKLLSKIVENKISTSFIFYGESGTGKTSAACALANDMNLKYALFNASIENKNRLLELIRQSNNNWRNTQIN